MMNVIQETHHALIVKRLDNRITMDNKQNELRSV